MKKTLAILAVLAICVSMFAACGASKPVETTAPIEPAEYTIYNTTGAKLTELYLYEVGAADKGENYAANGIDDGANTVITRQAANEEGKAVTYVLEFVAEGMDAQKFETLHYEVAPISLKSVDAASGATPIAFQAPAN